VLLQAALVPSLAAGLVAVVVLTALRGPAGLLGGALGLVVAGAFFASGLAAMARLVRDANPLLVVSAALAVYLGQMIALLLVLVLLGDASWLDPVAFGVVVLVVALAWQGFQVRAFLRTRRPVFDEPAPGPDGGGATS
jgi:ATP synthase protein I